MKNLFKKGLSVLLFIVLSVFLAACGSDEAENQAIENEQTEEVEQPQEEVKNPINKKIDVNKELSFNQFDAVIKSVKVYEKDDSILANIKIDWKNRAYDYGYPEMTFFVATRFDVKQGDTSLTEINEAWDPMVKYYGSGVFHPTALESKMKINLTYELKDESTPIDIIFTTNKEPEETETVTIEIKE